jgi:hypothetical protein
MDQWRDIFQILQELYHILAKADRIKLILIDNKPLHFNRPISELFHMLHLLL